MILGELTFGGPYRIAQLRFVKDDGGNHRECRAPGDDISDLPDDARKAITEAWSREVVAAYRDATKDVPREPDPEPALDRLALLESRLAKLEQAASLRVAITR